MNIRMPEICKELEYAFVVEYAAVFLQVTNFRMTNLEREYGITVCYSVHLLLYCIFYSVHLLLYCILYSVHLLLYCIFYSVHLLLYCIFYSVHLLLYCMFYSVHLLTLRTYCICYVCYLCRLPSRLVIYNSTSVVRPT